MAADITQRDALDLLAEEFIDRIRCGDSASVDQYTAKHPELADAINDLFPTIAAIERAKVDQQRNEAPRPAMPDKMGDFVVVREIGRGGMGVVFEAEQSSLGRRVALKVFPQHAHLDTGRFARFEREAKTAAQLHHTNIVPVFGVGEHEGLHYYVMQYIHGVGLDQVIQQLARTGKLDGQTQTKTAGSMENFGSAVTVAQALMSGSYVFDETRTSEFDLADTDPSKSQPPLNVPAPTPSMDGATESDSTARSSPDAPADSPLRFGQALKPGSRYWRSVAELGVQMGGALQYAHAQGTLHRDIKPANVILDYAGTAWVTDFGLAKAVEQDDLTATGKIIGTLRYMSPEQLRGKAEARSDLYSMGLTLYELATLQPAYGNDDDKSIVEEITHGQPVRPRKINPDIPADLETIILKCISRSPAERYSAASELVDDLQNFLDNQPINARRSSSVERLWKWSRRNPAVAALSMLAVGLLALTSIVATAGYLQARQHSENLETALAGQTKQRERAEANSELALNVLDRIYERFAPSRFDHSAELTVADAEGDDVTVSVRPAVSKDTAAILEGLLTFYDQLADQEGQSDTLRLKSASANRRVGDIRSRIQQFDKAETSYLRALELYSNLASRESGDVSLQIEIARLHRSLGSLYRSTKNVEDAEQAFSKALGVLKNTPMSNRRTREVRYELAHTHYVIGRRQLPTPEKIHHMKPPRHGPRRHRPLGGDAGFPPRGRDPEFPVLDPGPPRHDRRPIDPRGPSGPPVNEGHLIEAVFLLEELTEEAPKEPEYQFLLACCYCDLAPASFVVAEQETHDYSAKAISILENLVTSYPEVSDYYYELAETYSAFDIHNPEIRRGNSRDAVWRLREALDYSNALIARHPGVVDYTVLTATIHHKLGTMLRWSGRVNEAEAHFRQALGLQLQTAQLSNSYRAQLALIQQTLARLLMDDDRLEEAADLLEASVSQFEQMDEKADADTSSFDGIRGTSFRMLSDVYFGMGLDEDADDAWEQARKYGKAHHFGPPRFEGDRGPRPDENQGPFRGPPPPRRDDPPRNNEPPRIDEPSL
jgi:serine/threonine protein kinase